MRGKSVAWAVCLIPVLAGCGALRHGATEIRPSLPRFAERDLRKEARGAWQCVRQHYPRRAFTPEFHDGFLDGFADYLERGEAAPPPAAPLKYVRDRKYFTPEGQCLLRDYSLGFQYGTEVAIASGRRHALVATYLPDGGCALQSPLSPAPVVPFIPAPGGPQPLPSPRPEPEKKKKGSDDLPQFSPEEPQEPPRAGATEPVPVPKPEVPVVPPFDPKWPGDKFTPPSNPDLLPVPDPPLPVPGAWIEPLPVPPVAPKRTLPPVLDPPPLPLPVSMKVSFPAPPDAVPTLPAGVPTPLVLDDIPVIPFRHDPAGVGGLLPRK